LRRRCRLREVGGVGPAADGEEDFELAVLLLLQEELLQAAVDVGADIVPRVVGIVLVGVGPGVGEVHFAAFRTDVGEGVENVGQFVGWEVLGVVVAAINCL
jgi:hypothetical protein